MLHTILYLHSVHPESCLLEQFRAVPQQIYESPNFSPALSALALPELFRLKAGLRPRAADTKYVRQVLKSFELIQRGAKENVSSLVEHSTSLQGSSIRILNVSFDARIKVHVR